MGEGRKGEGRKGRQWRKICSSIKRIKKYFDELKKKKKKQSMNKTGHYIWLET